MGMTLLIAFSLGNRFLSPCFFGMSYNYFFLMIARSKAFNGDKYYFLLEALLEMGLILLLACLYEGQAGLLRG